MTLDLAVVREKDSLYLTMPPYLALLGMNHRFAFCTNYLPGGVATGVPVSQIRRNILRCDSLDEALTYLQTVAPATAANFLFSDGKRITDVEIAPSKVEVYEGIPCEILPQEASESPESNGRTKSPLGSYFAHTNHFLQTDIRKDKSCSRLSNAVSLLQKQCEVAEILENSGIYMPVAFSQGIGFGSVITVIMDPINGIFRYKDGFMEQFEELKL